MLSSRQMNVYIPSLRGLRSASRTLARNDMKHIPKYAAVDAVQVVPSENFAVLQTICTQDVLAYIVTVACSFLWVHMFRELTKKRVFDQKLSRKLVHITSGTLFILSWVLFSDAPSARYMAASVPLFNGVRLVGLGTGLIKDKNAVNSISREGNPRRVPPPPSQVPRPKSHVPSSPGFLSVGSIWVAAAPCLLQHLCFLALCTPHSRGAAKPPAEADRVGTVGTAC